MGAPKKDPIPTLLSPAATRFQKPTAGVGKQSLFWFLLSIIFPQNSAYHMIKGKMMKRIWDEAELVDQWTLQPEEYALVQKVRPDRHKLGFAVLLKAFGA